MTEQLGVQVTPGTNARQIVALGERFGGQVDRIWVQDQMLARNVYVVLGALAQRGCGVGTNVTWPFARNPIEMASAAGTITELLAPGRTLTIGMGSGGALVASLFDMTNRTAVVTEALLLMKQLWSGVEAELDTYPLLGKRLGYRPGAKAKLTYPVENPPNIVLAGLGPQITKVTATCADGSISASNLPVNSRAAMESPAYDTISNAAPLRARAAADPTFRRHFGMNVSVGVDRDLARAHARRQVALIVGNPGMWNAMDLCGLDVESGRAVKAAFDAGLGIEGAAQQVSSATVDALIIAGTPDDVVEPLRHLRGLACEHGYTDFFLGAPLGPDPIQAAELLSTIVIPAVWPERPAP
jgi:alkanesulfonate monooxygenase SsuD/methylene tetrahydromethanopterin reductase-like flavin-dependent oxidoreductase (luciferase family)